MLTDFAILFLTHIMCFLSQIKLQEAEKAVKLSTSLTAKLNEAEVKIAEKVIHNTKGPRPKKTDSVNTSSQQ